MHFSIADLLKNKFESPKQSLQSNLPPMIKSVSEQCVPTELQKTITRLQALQRRILQLRWRNFGRAEPSTKLASHLSEMYDSTVVSLVHTIGEEAHVSEVDAEKWDLFWENHFDSEGTYPHGLQVSFAEAKKVVG